MFNQYSLKTRQYLKKILCASTTLIGFTTVDTTCPLLLIHQVWKLWIIHCCPHDCWFFRTITFFFLPCLHVSGINAFLKDTVKKCVKNGYVQTLMGRRRNLPRITNTNPHIQAHVFTSVCLKGSFPVKQFFVWRCVSFHSLSGRATGSEHHCPGFSSRHC